MRQFPSGFAAEGNCLPVGGNIGAAAAPCSLFAPFPARACRMRFQALQKPLGPAEGRLILLMGVPHYAYLALGGPLASQSRA